MWIPTPVYERLPQFLFLAGLLCMSSGLYLGYDHPLTLVYFGSGLGCAVWGVVVFILRRLHRRNRQESEAQPRPVEAQEETSSL